MRRGSAKETNAKDHFGGYFGLLQSSLPLHFRCDSSEKKTREIDPWPRQNLERNVPLDLFETFYDEGLPVLAFLKRNLQRSGRFPRKSALGAGSLALGPQLSAS